MKEVKYKREQPTLKDPDRICTICNKEYKAVAPLQKTCSEDCRNIKNTKLKAKYKGKYTDRRKQYAVNRLKKNPNLWRDKYQKERGEILKALGSKCIVCGHDNPLHLHADYIPTMVGTGYRHPRHKKWILDNIKDFRLFCANHHYELTLSGKILGTNITQKRHNDK